MVNAYAFNLISDIDECNTGLDNCTENLNCRNQDGTFNCGSKPIIKILEPGIYHDIVQISSCIDGDNASSQNLQTNLTTTSPILLEMIFVLKVWTHCCPISLWNAYLAMNQIHFLSSLSLLRGYFQTLGYSTILSLVILPVSVYQIS